MTLIAILATLCAAQKQPKGPDLLVKGENFAIHIFKGSLQASFPHTRVVNPGMTALHTDTKTKEAKWLFSTGTYALPTAAISRSGTRLIGLFQTETHLAAAFGYWGRIYNRPDVPPNVPPNKAHYRVSVFEKNSGKKSYDLELDVSANRPEKVPEETPELGVIKKTEDGISILGTSLTVHPDGSIKRPPPPPRPISVEELAKTLSEATAWKWETGPGIVRTPPKEGRSMLFIIHHAPCQQDQALMLERYSRWTRPLAAIWAANGWTVVSDNVAWNAYRDRVVKLIEILEKYTPDHKKWMATRTTADENGGE